MERIEPLIIYTSPDNGIQWCINGGLAPWPGVQEGAILVDGVEGLAPPFVFIEHKGARQDGVTTQHTVYDPAEMDMQIEFTVPPNHDFPEEAAAAIRRVIRDWMASWDPKRPGMLTWTTPDMGKWWCTPRLYKAPPDRLFRAQARRLRQTFTWTIRNDDAFWRGTDSMSDFRFKYTLARDTFNRNDVGTLGPQWQQTYTGSGTSVFETLGTHAGWVLNGSADRTVVNRLLGVNEIQTIAINGAFTGGAWTYTVNGQTASGLAHNISAANLQTAIIALSNVGVGDVTVTGVDGGPYTVVFQGALGFQNITTSVSGAGLTPSGSANAVTVATTVEGTGPNTLTDNQVVRLAIGDIFQWPQGGFLDIWVRHNGNDASPTGVRIRLGGFQAVLSRFNAGVETVMKTEFLFFQPLWWETWTITCGTSTDPRHFKVKRDNWNVLDFKETGTGSALGPANRGIAFGGKVMPGFFGLEAPTTIDEISVGDNAIVAQSGHLTLTNFGDQDGWPRYLVYGPGTFKIGNGPGSAQTVQFGPLLDNQIVLLTTLPRLRGVVDLSPSQPEQVLSAFQAFMKLLITLAYNNNTPPLVDWLQSLFGILPPQGEMYSLLDGRFTTPIPPKPAGSPPTPVSIAVEIVGGDADSKVIAALTPLRVWPE